MTGAQTGQDGSNPPGDADCAAASGRSAGVRPLPEDVRAVGFDLDDTLVDHRGASADAYRVFAASVGLPADSAGHDGWLAAERHWFGLYRTGQTDFAGQRRGRLRTVLRAAALPVPTDDAMLDAVFGSYLSAYEAAWRLFDDVLPTFAALRERGVVIGVLTNGDGWQQRRKARLLPRLDALCISSEIAAAKPAAEAFSTLARELRTPLGALVFVGDDPRVDVQGARAAGLRAAQVDRASGIGLLRALGELGR